eukprot:1617670-Lingulodinium_polyedra.AAC.1
MIGSTRQPRARGGSLTKGPSGGSSQPRPLPTPLQASSVCSPAVRRVQPSAGAALTDGTRVRVAI